MEKSFMFPLIWPTLYAAIFSWDYLLGAAELFAKDPDWKSSIA